MQKKFRNWLLANFDFTKVDIFESAKIKLVADFSIYYLFFGLFSVIAGILGNDILVTILTFVILLLNYISVLTIRFLGTHIYAAKTLSINMVLGVIVTSFINNATIDIMYMTHFVVAILFAYFTVNRKWCIMLTIIMTLYLIILTYVKLSINHEYLTLFLNPAFVQTKSNLASPVVTIVNIIIVIILLDYHHKNQIEALRIVKQSNQLKDGILGIVAHDLRSPLANIIAINEFLKTNILEPENNDGESGEYVVMIDEMCQKSLNIINDLVDVAEIESPNFSLNLESVNLYHHIDSILKTHRVGSEKKGILLSLAKSEENIFIQIDIHKFFRVIDNLISNAVKFSSKNSEVIFSIKKHNNFALIEIKDNGIGIPEKLREFIFDKFTSAGRRGTEGEKSIGLGLSISKKIIELHRGKIWFESRENSGTSFFIELPITKIKNNA